MDRQDIRQRGTRQQDALSRLKTSCLQWLVLVGLASAVAGCAGSNPGASGTGPMAAPMTAMASLSGPPSAQTVTFESIDGPPQQVFDRFVRLLDTEAQTRNVAIVSRGSNAAGFRIRSYLAAYVRGGRTNIAWVWDVYDSNQQRALRLSGEESGGKAGRGDAWAIADEALLRRIAQTGLTGLASFVNGTGPADKPSDTPAPSGQAGPAIAFADPSAEAAPGKSQTGPTTTPAGMPTLAFSAY
jgi:hypothetical protein